LKKNLHLSMVLVCIVLGFLLATSFNTQKKNSEALNTPRKKNLISSVQELEKQRDVLKSQVESNRDQISKYEKRAAENQGIQTAFSKELEKVRLIAGLTDVKGSGLIITLADNPKYPQDDDPNNYVIHDYDIRIAVNSLWAGGAEAISVNDQRLISTSSVRCAGSTILLNANRLVTPYVIKAVGNPARMLDAINDDDNSRRLFNEVMTYYGLTAEIKQSNDVSIKGYSGGLLVENASVIGEES
jgi:uncharacterized protein YlxW (UPF0749 family)